MASWLTRLFGQGSAGRVEVMTLPGPAAPPEPSSPAEHPLASFVGAIASARADIVARVAEANSLTEREVMNAAQSLGAVVTCASRNRDETRRIAEMFDGGQARAGLARSLSRMSTQVEQHVEKLVSDAKAQEGAARRAQTSTESLIKASRNIEGMLKTARMLALNARIEAGRTSTQERAFTIVADEIRNLAELIAKTNAMMQELASNLSTTHVALLAQSQEVLSGAEKFAQTARGELESVRTEAGEFQRQADHAVSTSETGMADILRASQAALSSLQFQDVVAQGLMRIDQRLHTLELEVARETGDPELVDNVAPAVHVEMGGDKSIERAGAGEVNLF